MSEHNCSTCDQSFNSERELQEHQRSEHSGKQNGGEQTAVPESNTGDQSEGREKIAQP